jgi:hypothetical protein
VLCELGAKRHHDRKRFAQGKSNAGGSPSLHLRAQGCPGQDVTLWDGLLR